MTSASDGSDCKTESAGGSDSVESGCTSPAVVESKTTVGPVVIGVIVDFPPARCTYKCSKYGRVLMRDVHRMLAQQYGLCSAALAQYSARLVGFEDGQVRRLEASSFEVKAPNCTLLLSAPPSMYPRADEGVVGCLSVSSSGLPRGRSVFAFTRDRPTLPEAPPNPFAIPDPRHYRNLTLDNAVSKMVLAQSSKRACEYVEMFFLPLTKSRWWMRIKPKMMQRIIALPRLNVNSEEQVWGALQRWSKRTRNVKPKDMLASVVPYVRWHCLDAHTLETSVQDSGVLPRRVLLQVLKHLASPEPREVAPRVGPRLWLMPPRVRRRSWTDVLFPLESPPPGISISQGGQALKLNDSAEDGWRNVACSAILSEGCHHIRLQVVDGTTLVLGLIPTGQDLPTGHHHIGDTVSGIDIGLGMLIDRRYCNTFPGPSINLNRMRSSTMVMVVNVDRNRVRWHWNEDDERSEFLSLNVASWTPVLSVYRAGTSVVISHEDQSSRKSTRNRQSQSGRQRSSSGAERKERRGSRSAKGAERKERRGSRSAKERRGSTRVKAPFHREALAMTIEKPATFLEACLQNGGSGGGGDRSGGD